MPMPLLPPGSVWNSTLKAKSPNSFSRKRLPPPSLGQTIAPSSTT
jgi:hypothetical protein